MQYTTATPMLDDMVDFLLANGYASEDDMQDAYHMAEDLCWIGLTAARVQ